MSSTFICDPFAPDVCLPLEAYDTVITYAKGTKKQRKHAKLMDQRLMKLGIPVIPVGDVSKADVVIKKKWDRNTMNEKFFEALEVSNFDGDVYINKGPLETVCLAMTDTSTLVVVDDGSWFMP